MARKATKVAPEKTAMAHIHDQNLVRGPGGELHQIASGDTPMLTTAQGGPVADDQNTLKIGPRGPSLIEDFHFREKIGEAAARDFVADAFAHCKFIGCTAAAAPLLSKAGVAADADEGLIPLEDAASVSHFVSSCRKLRLWARETSVKL